MFYPNFSFSPCKFATFKTHKMEEYEAGVVGAEALTDARPDGDHGATRPKQPMIGRRNLLTEGHDGAPVRRATEALL